MRECIRCRVVKDDDEFPLADGRMKTVDATKLRCTPCATEQRWLDDFPPSRDCVYLVQSDVLWKIGYSNNLASRLAALRNMSAVPVRLDHVWPGDRSVELALHRRFRGRRHHGEWFALRDREVVALKREPLPGLVVPPKRATTGRPRASRVVVSRLNASAGQSGEPKCL